MVIKYAGMFYVVRCENGQWESRDTAGGWVYGPLDYVLSGALGSIYPPYPGCSIRHARRVDGKVTLVD